VPSPSPIDPALLEPVLAPTLGRSRTLPAEAYTSQAVFDWEVGHLFEDGWVCIGRAEDVGEPGDQRAYRIGNEGILVVRDREGRLRGFYNTCRHRGHELLEPGAARNLRAIKCPYHAWVYQLDGTLGAAPRFGDQEGFDKTDYPLIAARIHEWNGWVFVNASGAAVPFEEYVGNLDELLAPWEAGRLFVGATHEYVIEANWKTITENYHECYHCPSIHPALCVVTPPDSGDNFPHDGHWVGGSMELKEFAATMSLTGASEGVRIRGLSDRQAREVYYFGLFPNLLLSLHPDYVMAHRFEPLGPGRSKVECQWLFPPEAKDRPGFSPGYASEFWDITNREDWLACESVYRGLHSEGFRQGPFAWSEDEVHIFMAMVARAYLDGAAARPPQVHRRDASGV
jgi:phenylpropionate dioxygenase-like ring-hydroxylating dioxygenase large terminal subunit